VLDFLDKMRRSALSSTRALQGVLQALIRPGKSRWTRVLLRHLRSTHFEPLVELQGRARRQHPSWHHSISVPLQQLHLRKIQISKPWATLKEAKGLACTRWN